MIRFLGSLIDRLFVVLGAFIGSQIPEFMNQYTQRLAGHVNELNRLVDNLQKIAGFSDKSLDQYIHKFITSTDPDFSRQGEFMQGVVTRWHELTFSLQALRESTMWNRPYVFISHLNADIANSTLRAFSPGFTLTIEGLCYAGAGLLIGYLFYQSISKLLQVGSTRALALFKSSI